MTPIHRLPMPCIVSLALLLGGCGSFLESKEPPIREYWVVPEPSVTQPRLPEVSVILDVSAAPGLDRVGLLQLEASGLLREYAGARWTDTATGVIRLYLSLALEQAQPAASPDAASETRQRIALQVNLREFYVLAAPDRDSARLAARVSYACGGREGSLVLRASQPPTEPRLAAVVAAHRRNLDQFSQQLIDLLARNCG